jgi:hypothetical protein
MRASSVRLLAGLMATLAVAMTGDAHADPYLDSALALAPLSGSRLVPMFLTGEDESRQFVGWFDRMRGEPCAFAVAADGTMRCLPTEVVEARFFVDGACKQRIAAVVANKPGSCAHPNYVVETESATCGSVPRSRVHQAGVPLRPAVVYAESNGVCSRVPVDASAMYVAVGREVPPAAFVAARYTTGRPALGLKTEYDAAP